MSNIKYFTNGLLKENPTFVLGSGDLPYTGCNNCRHERNWNGMATTFVLVFSNLFIALLKNVIPDKVRIAAFIVLIATFVTIVDLVMKAFTPDLYKTLGIFIPLIVVNCIILGGQKHLLKRIRRYQCILDGLGNGYWFYTCHYAYGFYP